MRAGTAAAIGVLATVAVVATAAAILLAIYTFSSSSHTASSLTTTTAPPVIATTLPTTTSEAPGLSSVVTLTTAAPTTTVVLPAVDISLAAATTAVPEPTSTTTTPTHATTSTATTRHVAVASSTADGCDIGASIPRVLESVLQVITDSGVGTAFYMGHGLFVTAAHVVAGDYEEEVMLRSGDHTLWARVQHYDLPADVAVLYVAAQPIPPLEWAPSSSLTPGAPVAVVGYPHGVTGTASVTDGRLSRIAEYPGGVTFLQTNAEANPGNSGGPVVDACGQVVGVVTSKLVSVDIEGISYAVAAATAKDRIAHLLESGGWGVPSDVPKWYEWASAHTSCMTNEEKLWLHRVSRELDWTAELRANMREILELAAEGDSRRLVTADPTWQQALEIIAVDFYYPANSILEAPAPGGLGAHYHLLEGTVRTFHDFASKMYQSTNSDLGATGDALSILDFDALNHWVDSIEQYCDQG